MDISGEKFASFKGRNYQINKYFIIKMTETKTTNRAKKVLLTAPLKSIQSGGLWKAFFYSFGSWIAVCTITYLKTDEVLQILGKSGWLIPLFNTIAVFLKNWFDEARK